MDQIQKELIKAGHKDLAQEYYKRITKQSAHRFNLLDLIFETLGIEKIPNVTDQALLSAHPNLKNVLNEAQRELDKINWNQVKSILAKKYNVQKKAEHLGYDDVKIYRATLSFGEMGIGIQIGNESARLSKTDTNDLISKLKGIINY